MIKYYILSLLVMIMVNTQGYAVSSDSPDVILSNAFETIAMQVNSDEPMTTIRTTIESFVDFPLIARLSIGKKYWTSADVATRDLFVQTFTDYLFKSYLNQLPAYASTTIQFSDPLIIKDKAKVTGIIPGEQSLELGFKLYQKDDTWLLYDIDIASVSLLKSFRMQFAPILSEGGLDDLILSLQ